MEAGGLLLYPREGAARRNEHEQGRDDQREAGPQLHTAAGW